MRNLLVLTALAGAAAAGNVTIPLDVKVSLSGGNVTSSFPYGLLLEDLNHAIDGGIYAELVRNRAFQGNDDFPRTLVGWSGLGGAELSLQNLSQPLSKALPTSMRVTGSAKNGTVGFANEGWWGIDVKVQPYKGSFWVKGTYSGWFTVALTSTTSGKTLGSVKVKGAVSKQNWVECKYTLVPSHAAQNSNNTLEITFDASLAKDGYLDFNLISLFPPTFNNRPNGLRKDLVEVMADTQPRLLRFPGGSNLEGLSFETRWDWKATLGPLKDRPGRAGVWTYYETGGMGLVEYMELVEDMQFEPLLGVWSGLSYGSDTNPEVLACNSTELDYYIQDALNELEFLVGSETTKWGAVRASLGYPKPWNVTYVEIGNEDNLVGGLPSYPCRFQKFSDAITSKYPWMVPVASTVEFELPPGAAGDYHQYVRPDDLVDQFNYYDHFNQSHKYFNAEYAAVEPNDNGRPVDWGSPFPSYQNWIQAVSEAVYCIGSERNADRVISRGYAPWFKNVNYFTWSPDLITFSADPAQTVLSTSYHVVKLFSSNVITKTLPAPSSAGFGPSYWVAGEGEARGSYVFKAAIYNSTMDVPVSLSFEGLKRGTKASLTVLTQKEEAGVPNGLAQNVFGGADTVQTTVSAVEANGDGVFEFSLPNLSVAVLATE